MSTLSRLFTVTLLGCALAACTTAPTQNTPPHFLLLGEVHDNPDGHRLRVDYLTQLVQQGWRPTIAMEQIDIDQNAVLHNALSHCSDAQCVIDKIPHSGWEWSYYAPVINLAIQYHLPVVGANLSRKDAFNIVKEGLTTSLPPEVMKQFNLPAAIPAAVLSAQMNEIQSSHCGMAPQDMLKGFAQAQIARDVMMAKTMLDNASATQDVVLLAGNGHVRKDIGVPQWLKQQHQTNVIAVGYLEPNSAMPDNAFDVTHTIPAHERGDMCKNLKMQPAK